MADTKSSAKPSMLERLRVIDEQLDTFDGLKTLTKDQQEQRDKLTDAYLEILFTSKANKEKNERRYAV